MPPAVVTATAPLVFPDGTVAIIVVEVFETMVAATPPKLTAVALERLVPFICTPSLTPDVTASKLVITGGVYNVTADAVSANAPCPVTEIFSARTR